MLLHCGNALWVFGGELESRVPVDDVLYKYSDGTWTALALEGAPSPRNAPAASASDKSLCESVIACDVRVT